MDQNYPSPWYFLNILKLPYSKFHILFHWKIFSRNVISAISYLIYFLLQLKNNKQHLKYTIKDKRTRLKYSAELLEFVNCKWTENFSMHSLVGSKFLNLKLGLQPRDYYISHYCTQNALSNITPTEDV